MTACLGPPLICHLRCCCISFSLHLLTACSMLCIQPDNHLDLMSSPIQNNSHTNDDGCKHGQLVYIKGGGMCRKPSLSCQAWGHQSKYYRPCNSWIPCISPNASCSTPTNLASHSRVIPYYSEQNRSTTASGFRSSLHKHHNTNFSLPNRRIQNALQQIHIV